MVLIVRYGEIGVKGKNRSFFENKLVYNIKSCLKFNNVPFDKIIRNRGRIIVYCDKYFDLKMIFGISSFSCAEELKIDFEMMAERCINALRGCKTFSVSCQRLNKNLPFTSVDFSKNLSELITQKLDIKIKLDDPDKTLFFELINDFAYFFTDKISCFEGLPLCSQGRALCFVNGRESVLATLLLMKRGCCPVIFRKENIDIRIIEKFSPGIKLEIHNINDFKEIINFKKRYNTNLLVLGQNLKSVYNLPEEFAEFVILRPLIGLNDEEINELMKKYEAA